MTFEAELTRSGSGSGGSAHVEDLYQAWFLEYASYVILDRAVPHIKDGLKPVQRRILHALWELDDGRLNKAANIIGHTMRYHPHGDMAIEDALVKLAQKDLLIDMQGNWGNTLTGDRAAAPRYIEARLSKFGKEILFQADLTEWQASYDGRNKEPQHLPVKFPLLLALGVEGIAVGLQTKILPHNFNELCEAAILHLEGKTFNLLPDFPSGGVADFSAYTEGRRGGKVKVRARIKVLDSKTLQIDEIPFGSTTTSLIESILAANDKGKIKIKRVEDNTGHEVDIRIYLPAGISAEQTLEALFAFTDCELSISVNCCVIQDDKPAFLGVGELLRDSADRTKALLQRELELSQANLLAKLHKASLEKIFIEKKIYQKLEGVESWEAALEALEKGFKPHLKGVIQPVTKDDYEALLEIRFKRLTKYDSQQATEHLLKLEAELKEVQQHLSQLIRYTIAWFKSLKQNYGKKLQRRTEIGRFAELSARELVIANQKLYVNRQEGFIGTSLKKDEFVTECSDLDEVLAIRRNGQAMLAKVSDKTFVGEDIIHIGLLPPQAGSHVLQIIYREAADGPALAKAIKLSGWSRDKSYELAKGITELLFAQIWPEGAEAYVELSLKGETRALPFELSQLPTETRNSRGRIITSRNVVSIARSQTPKLSYTVQYDPKKLKIGEGVGGQTVGSFAPDILLVALSRQGHLKIFNASYPMIMPAPLFACRPLPLDGILTMVSLNKAKDQLFIRRIKTEDLGDGHEFRVSEGKDNALIAYSFATDLIVRLEYKVEHGVAPPAEYLSVADWANPRSLTASAIKITRKNLEKISFSEIDVKPV